MNERVKQLMTEAGYAAPEIAGRANKLVELLVKECLLAIDNTNKHHAHTTFDIGLVEATIIKSKKAVKEYFGVDDETRT